MEISQDKLYQHQSDNFPAEDLCTVNGENIYGVNTVSLFEQSFVQLHMHISC